MVAKKNGKNAEQIQGINVSKTKPTAAQVLVYDSATDRYIPELRATIPMIDATQKYHGFVNRTDSVLTFTNTAPDRTLTITGTYDYYYKGTKITVSSPKTAQVGSGYGLSFIYLNSGGTLTVSTTALSYFDYVPVAVVYWNGSSGFWREERHAYDVNIEWHIWAHNTVGARYGSGLGFSFTGTGGTTTFSVSTGDTWDEDIHFLVLTPTTSGRIFYPASASTLNFDTAISTTPFKWASGTSRAQFANAANSYILTDIPNGNFANVWVYSTPDPLYPITFLLDTTTYGTATLARAASPPNLAAFTSVSSEIKLIWRLVVSHLGVVQTLIASDDLRQTTSLPSGGINSIAAASVTYSATGSISAVNVQSAISELDSEKEPVITVLPISKGGTGVSTAPTTGQLLVGKTDGTWVLTTLTAGANITVTNTDGVITIAGTGGGSGLDEPNVIARAILFGGI